MSSKSCNYRRHAPATARNRDAILEVLRGVLPVAGTVLEIASGTGEHAAWLTPRLPGLTWQPSDRDDGNLASIAAWTTGAAETEDDGRIRPPLRIDVTDETWAGADRIADLAAVVCINMIHIAPWVACEGLITGAARRLPAGGVLYLYGPYRRHGKHTAQSNADFDFALRQQDPAWGIRDVETVTALADIHGFDLTQVVDMPANNLSVVFRRRAD
jgi:hypothetical protein